MCRFTLYVGPPITISSLVTEPEHSLIHQSFHSRERSEPLNGDGFGVAWWPANRSSEPAVFKSTTPAWSNKNLLELAPVVESGFIMAHVRAATRGSGTLEVNCHPFKSHGYAFMHNGDVGDFIHLKRHVLAQLSDESFATILGSTDSEHVFALFLDEARAGKVERGDAEGMGRALERAVQRVIDLAKEHAPKADLWLNFAVCDGAAAAVMRYTNVAGNDGSSLYLNTGRRYICEEGMCRMIAPQRGEGAVLVSSEPLSQEPGWSPVPARSLVLVHPDRSTSTCSLPY
ncbi:MAG: class II glutamine amidotransferase [Planctomycetes bacterium]|nr:class II glutamine amidotransferase [Planctomycetota bacterium]